MNLQRRAAFRGARGPKGARGRAFYRASTLAAAKTAGDGSRVVRPTGGFRSPSIAGVFRRSFAGRPVVDCSSFDGPRVATRERRGALSALRWRRGRRSPTEIKRRLKAASFLDGRGDAERKTRTLEGGFFVAPTRRGLSENERGLKAASFLFRASDAFRN